MAASGKKNMFNEATRVQMPAMVHLTRLGYTYFGKITEDMAGTVSVSYTHLDVYKRQFLHWSISINRILSIRHRW